MVSKQFESVMLQLAQKQEEINKQAKLVGEIVDTLTKAYEDHCNGLMTGAELDEVAARCSTILR
jgi:uncharacterized membrane-anchored protein YhcB (DUF1043 family)